MSSRNRTTSGASTSSASTAANLPPPRKSPPMKPVSPPLSSTRLHRLIYVLVLLSALLAAYYSYRVVQWKTDVGGWWNLALGRRPPQFQARDGMAANESAGKKTRRGKGGKEPDSVEDRINALAEALGMPPKDLASAIAGAVREYVPPASLSSVAARETGPAVEELVKGARGGEHKDRKVDGDAAGASGTTGGVVEGVIGGMESFVGMDEP